MPVSPRTGGAHRGRRRRGRSGGINPPTAIDGRIWYSGSSARTSPDLLSGAASLTGNRYIHLIDQHGIASVQWYLSTNAGSITTSLANHLGSSSDANWVRNTTTYPHDLMGGSAPAANPLDLSAYANGTSLTVGVYITKLDASTATATATFTTSTGSNPVDRIAHGTGRLLTHSTLFGALLGVNSTDRPNGIVPKVWRTGNLNRKEPWKAIQEASSFGQNAAGFANIVLTVPLAWQGAGPNKDPAGSLAKLTAVATDATVYRDGNSPAGTQRNATYLYTGIAQSLVTAGFPRAVLRLGHEHNGGWYPWSSANGRHELFVSAWTVAATAIRAVAPLMVLDWNVADPGAAPGGGVGENWPVVEGSYPASDLYDVIGLDLYCRGPARNITLVNEQLAAHAARGVAKSKPLSYPEIGVCVPDLDPDSPRYTGTRTTPQATDEQAAEFVETVTAHANTNDMAYLSWFFGDGEPTQFYTYRPRSAWHPDTFDALLIAYGHDV